LVGLKMTAAGKPLAWRRDDVDMYAFHVEVPADGTAVEVSLDYVTPATGVRFFSSPEFGGPATTDQLLVLNWHTVILYPQGKPATDYTYKASVQLPAGWNFGTALPVASQPGNRVEFEPVSLVTLIDSPLLAGAQYRVISLAVPGTPPAEIDVAADTEAGLEIPQSFIEQVRRLMEEAAALFDAHHYRAYRFLLARSGHVGLGGSVEHHESVVLSGLAWGGWAHEFAHSWNGKYRRPAGLATTDYQQPIKNELLWVYEGLTEYLGSMLAARSGMQTPEQFREYLAFAAAYEDHQAGRIWRPLVDTSVGYQTFVEAPDEWTVWRREDDYYLEGALIWLEVDTIIRRQTSGHRSLDNFCRSFFGPPSGPPEVKTYTFDDLVAVLNEIAPYDWRRFFRARVYEISPHAPLGGIGQGGWKLVYNEKPEPEAPWPWQAPRQRVNLKYSLGMVVQNDSEGTIVDVVPGMPAAKAGIAPGMKLRAINGQRWSPEMLLAALKPATAEAGRLELLVENAGFLRTYAVNYGGGARFPHLEHDPSRPDLLGEIIKPQALPSAPAR
jgi:predicted metalloprotease with PDZ domain